MQLDLFGSDDPRVRELSELALRHMLEALTLADQIYLLEHPDTPSPFDRPNGLFYQAEPEGSEDWNAIGYVLANAAKGIGSDCEDLAAYLCAWMRSKLGIACQAVPLPPHLVKGTLLYHIVSELADGRRLDPSRALGMR